MNNRILVEPYSGQPPDLVVGLILPIQRDEFGIKITREDQPDLEKIADFYQKGLGNFWVALDGSVLVGTLAFKDIGNRSVALRKMFVRKDRRGKEHGVARRLLEAALVFARTKNILDIYLGTTAQYLAAHRFYEKNGFAEIAKADLPEAFPIMSVDSKFYHLKMA